MAFLLATNAYVFQLFVSRLEEPYKASVEHPREPTWPFSRFCLQHITHADGASRVFIR